MSTDADVDDAKEPGLAARSIRGLLQRHGIPKHRQAPMLAEILGVPYRQAHRKLTGLVSWSLEEQQTVARRFGETLADVVDAVTSSDAEAATLLADDLRLPCRFWRGAAMAAVPGEGLVAVHQPAGWVVASAGRAPAGDLFSVRKLTLAIESAQGEPRRKIAVLDDQSGLAENLASQLRRAGFDVVPYVTIEALQAEFRPQRFDAYVLDWLIGRQDVGQLIAAIRAHDSSCPIAILTGQLARGMIDEDVMARAVATYKQLFVFEKPERVPIIVATLNRAFEVR
jgi:ActR/RegA family two-component response regulator